jgi:hypothetical protein
MTDQATHLSASLDIAFAGLPKVPPRDEQQEPETKPQPIYYEGMEPWELRR